MEKIKGTVEEIIFYNEENGYSVFDIDSDGVLITAVGILPYLAAGENVVLEGDYINHPLYGKQFSVTGFVKTPPSSVDSIYKYLASGLIKGIGAATAKKIVDKFSEEALEVIENDPERPAEIKGISLKKACEINNEYIKQFGMRNLAIFLQDNNISPNFAGKIFKKYGSTAVDKIRANPYILARDIHGIGFKTADNLALKLGTKYDDMDRLKAAILYTLNETSMSSGHTYCPSDILINKTTTMLTVDRALVTNALTSLIFEKSVVCEKNDNIDCIYSIPLHLAEVNAAYRLKKLNEIPPSAITKELCEIVDKVEKQDFVPETFVSTDVADLRLLGNGYEHYEGKVLYALDHHGTNKRYSKYWVVDPHAASACEIVLEVIKMMGVSVDKEIAECIYTGISTDTGCFKFANTTSATLRNAADMLDFGIDAAEINRVMFETKSRNRIELERLTLDSMSFHLDGKVAFVTITNEMREKAGASDDDLEGMTSLSRQVEGVKIGVTLRQKEDGEYKISVRSHPPVDAAELCGNFGGGGHVRAAGCTLNGTPDDIKEQMLKVCCEALEKCKW